MAKKARTPLDLIKKKISFLENAEKKMGKRVAGLQEKLLNQILSELLKDLDFDASGLLKTTVKNYARTAQVDTVFNAFRNVFQRGMLKDFANTLLDIPTISAPYYKKIGIKASKVDRVIKSTNFLESYIGFRKGKVIKGSYIDRLGKGEQITAQIKDTLLNAISSNASLSDYTKGLKQLIVGDDKKPGIMERYYKQYAYDTFSQVDSITQDHIAKELDLVYFVYEGSLIQTSRPFCEKRAGKVFHVRETDDWKDDPDLVDKKTADSYQPLIERGRYNCRHWLRYVTKDTAIEMRPELKDLNFD